MKWEMVMETVKAIENIANEKQLASTHAKAKADRLRQGGFCGVLDVVFFGSNARARAKAYALGSRLEQEVMYLRNLADRLLKAHGEDASTPKRRER